MQLRDWLSTVMILEPPRVRSRTEALGVILERLGTEGRIDPSLIPELQEALLRREELGPTGIGEGVAVPHAAHPRLSRSVGVLAVSRIGLDFETFDRRPVDIIILILSPTTAEGDEERAKLLDRVLRQVRLPATRLRLRRAVDEGALRDLIGEFD